MQPTFIEWLPSQYMKKIGAEGDPVYYELKIMHDFSGEANYNNTTEFSPSV